jgi:hypothetical protein
LGNGCAVGYDFFFRYNDNGDYCDYGDCGTTGREWDSHGGQG